MTVDVSKSSSFQVSRHPAVENEYVPSPENSPKISHQRMRATTVSTSSFGGVSSSSDYHFQHRGGGSAGNVNSLYPVGGGVVQPHPHHHHAHPLGGVEGSGNEDDSPGPLTHKHLSVVSMESGLSFGYDVEKDFNPAHPLESQPWFHGKIQRGDAENLLHEDGDFLVRENTTMSNTYTLTLRWRGVADHTLIGTTEVISTTSMIRGSAVKYQFDSGAFDSIPELIYNHLKYQIPIDQNQHTLIVNPICRPGNQGKVGGGGMFGLYPTSSSNRRSNWSPESSPAASTYSAGSSQRRSGSPAESVASTIRGHMVRLGASTTPPLSRHLSSSSGDLLEASRVETDLDVGLRNAISPPPDTRGRAMTLAVANHAGLKRSILSTSGGHAHHATPLGGRPRSGEELEPVHQKMDSFGDYEVMESVSILKDSPSLGSKKPHPSVEVELASGHDYARPQPACTLSKPPRERVKYAEIRYPRNGDGRGVIISSGSSTVNYAEVRFACSNSHSNTPSPKPHPFASHYDTIPAAARREATPPGGPYQSRAELLSQRLGEPAYSTPVPSAARKHISNYATIQFPRQASLPTVQQSSKALSAHNSTPLIPGSLVPEGGSGPIPVPQPEESQVPIPQAAGVQVPIAHTDGNLYAFPNKNCRLSGRSQDLSSSNDSLLSATTTTTTSST